VLLDWKFAKNINDCCFERFEGKPPVYGYGPCQFLENCNYVHYSLQLNLYKYILEKHYHYYVKKMMLIQFHNSLKSAGVYLVGNLQKVIKEIMATRKWVLQQK